MPVFTEFKVLDWIKNMPRETLFLGLIGISLLTVIVIQQLKLKEVI